MSIALALSLLLLPSETLASEHCISPNQPADQAKVLRLARILSKKKCNVRFGRSSTAIVRKDFQTWRLAKDLTAEEALAELVSLTKKGECSFEPMPCTLSSSDSFNFIGRAGDRVTPYYPTKERAFEALQSLTRLGFCAFEPKPCTIEGQGVAKTVNIWRNGGIPIRDLAQDESMENLQYLVEMGYCSYTATYCTISQYNQVLDRGIKAVTPAYESKAEAQQALRKLIDAGYCYQ